MDKKKLEELRTRAKERLRIENFGYSTTHEDRMDTTLHDLHTYQVELEIQNEELRQTQEELVETRDRYIDLYDFAPIGYLTVNKDKLIMETNLTLADLLGEERQLLIGQPVTNFILNDDQDIFYKLFQNFSPGIKRSCELRMRKKGGEFFWAQLECRACTKNEKPYKAIRIALNDISEAKHMENEITKAQKLEATALLAGGIAHDFNNFLAVILGNLEIIQNSAPAEWPAADRLKDAQDACLNAANLTKKFLTFASGGKPFTILIHARTFIMDSISLALAGSNIDCDYHLPDDLWSLDIDVGQMAQAVGNVITNAKESMTKGGVIRVSAENIERTSDQKHGNLNLSDGQTKYVRVVIEDQGEGIAEDILPKIYDPYFSTKKIGLSTGLGLGLTIAHSIINKHGGFIEITSQLHIGTTVSLYLPASDAQVDLEGPLPPKDLSLNKKILVMDDDDLVRLISQKMLESLGYEVQVACHGDEAVRIYMNAQLTDAPFGAVLLDLTIKGGMGGKDTIKHLKEINPEVKAIVASGYSNDPILSNCTEYGFVVGLQKPYRMNDLEKALEEIDEGWKTIQ